MIPLDIILNAEGRFPEIKEEQFGATSAVGALPDGTESGQPAILVEITLPGGKKAYGQTTWRLFHAACRAIEARYGTPS